MSEQAPLRRAHGWQLTVVVVCLGVMQLFLQILAVRPRLPPAGLGATIGADSPFAGLGRGLVIAPRPPTLGGETRGDLNVVQSIAAGGPAEKAGLAPGDRHSPRDARDDGQTADLTVFHGGTIASPKVLAWRSVYWLGLDGALRLDLQDRGGRTPDGGRRSSGRWGAVVGVSWARGCSSTWGC